MLRKAYQSPRQQMQEEHPNLGYAQRHGLVWTVQLRGKIGIAAENWQKPVWHFVRARGDLRDRRENLVKT